MTAGEARPPARTAKARVHSCLTTRQHAERLSITIVLLTITSAAEMHIAVTVVSMLAIGIRDIILILFFADEEGLL